MKLGVIELKRSYKKTSMSIGGIVHINTMRRAHGESCQRSKICKIRRSNKQYLIISEVL